MYIAAQGDHYEKIMCMSRSKTSTLLGPADNSLEDFWRMIWESRVLTLVMLTKIFEGRVN